MEDTSAYDCLTEHGKCLRYCVLVLEAWNIFVSEICELLDNLSLLRSIRSFRSTIIGVLIRKRITKRAVSRQKKEYVVLRG